MINVCEEKVVQNFNRETWKYKIARETKLWQNNVKFYLKAWDFIVAIDDEGFDSGSNICKHKGNEVK